MDWKFYFIASAIGNILLHLTYHGQPRPAFNFPLEIFAQAGSFLVACGLVYLFEKLQG